MLGKIQQKKSARIDTFDLLRGYFLIVIIINHLSYFPSGLDILTGRGVLYVSSAEGFFLVSGILLGNVRGRKLMQKSFATVATLLLKRSLQLYITSIILVLVFTWLGWTFFMDNPNLKASIAPTGTPLITLLWQTISLQYSYGWADFLRYYAIFLAAAPIMIWLLRNKLWYLVVIISFGIWTLYPMTSGGLLWLPLSWQTIFFSGLIIGFYWNTLSNWYNRIPSPWQARFGAALFASFITTVCLSALLVFSSYYNSNASLSALHHDIGDWFNKDRMPIPRLLLGAVWFWGLFWLVRRYESWFVRKIGWLVLPLGTNSLYVYTIQAFIVFFFHLFLLPPQVFVQQSAWWINLGVTLLAIAIVWVAVKQKFLFKIIPR